MNEFIQLLEHNTFSIILYNWNTYNRSWLWEKKIFEINKSFKSTW